MFLQAPGQLRPPQTNEKVDQAGVAVFVEAEQGFVHRATVCTCAVEHAAGLGDLPLQVVSSENLFRIADKLEIPPNPLACDEEPLPHAGLTFNRAEATSEGEIVILTGFIVPAKL